MAATSLINSNLGFPTSASTFLFAAFVQLATPPGSFNLMYDTAAMSGVQISVTYSNIEGWQITVNAWDAEGGLAVSGTVNADTDLSGGWNAIAVSCDVATETLQVLVDDLPAVTPGAFTFSGLPIATGARDTWIIGGDQSGNTNLGQLWFAVGQGFFDLTNPNNANVLFGGANCVQDWGTSGQLITGLSPQVFLYGPADDYPHNYGTGGAFTVSGPFGNYSPPPAVCAP
jgi:hypothetical protein